ncbi:MAG: DEAD/DEAH box helicase [Firmicutes bacterium]|nr:DEAD/DEAH box helicase [Bacillota bacterium]
MNRRYYLVYLPTRAEILITSRPEAVAALREDEPPRQILVGDRSFPHWLAAALARRARTVLAERRNEKDLRRVIVRAVRERLRWWGRPATFTWETWPPTPFFPFPSDLAAAVLAGLEGKILSSGEIHYLFRGGLPGAEGEDLLAELALRGEIEVMPAVEALQLDRAVCRRCGQIVLQREDCWFCGEPDCWICPACHNLGPATGCGTLYARARPAKSGRAVALFPPSFGFTLTPAQQRAAAALADFLRSGAEEFLLWAVCGAGKTEVVFSALTVALAQGDRVLLSTPRRDVAADLAARARTAFPSIGLAVHHGGHHEEENPDPLLTVATTHQCLRFYRAFDLVILDEVDAFPYHGNRMLYHAVARARGPGGRLVYVTATPPDELTGRLRDGRLPYVRLPVRPHGHPLPVPQFIRLSLRPGDIDREVPSALAEIIAATIAKGRRLLLFVPTVRAAEEAGRTLAKWGADRGLRIAWLHAADPEREAKRTLFAQGRLAVLVTTTVLERGLTLGPIDVGVLWADHEAVFDAATLIQMAGRAGRLAAAPEGTVYFLAARISPAMKAARAAILAANEEAAREGFLTTLATQGATPS